MNTSTLTQQHSQLAQYPVVSVELLNLDDLQHTLSLEQINATSKAIFTKMQQQLEKHDAKVVYQQHNVLFFSVPNAKRLSESLDRAFRLAIGLIRKQIPVKGIPINVRAGLALCAPTSEELQLAAVPERTIAQAQQLVVSQEVYERFEYDLPFEKIGPVELLGKEQLFYRLKYQDLVNAHQQQPYNSPISNAPLQPIAEEAPVLQQQPTEYTIGQPEAPILSSYAEVPLQLEQPMPLQNDLQSELLEFSQHLSEPAPLMQEHTIEIPSEMLSTPPEEASVSLSQAVAKMASASAEQLTPPEAPKTARQHWLLNDTLPEIDLSDSGLDFLQEWLQHQPTQATANAMLGDALWGAQATAHNLQTVPYQQAPVMLLDVLNQWSKTRPKTGKSILIHLPETCGKTTMLNAVRQQMPQEQLIWLSGQFYPHYKASHTPYIYWVELVYNLLGLPLEGADQQAFQQHADQMLAQFGLTPECSNAIKAVVGLPTNTALSKSTTLAQALFGIMQQFSQNTPIALLLEDLQYADEESLAVLQELITLGLLNQPVSVIMTSAPNFGPLGTLEALLQKTDFTTVEISPPNSQDLALILQAPLGVDIKKLPDNMLSSLISQDASPMLIEETMRWLMNVGGLSQRKKDGAFIPEDKIIKTVSFPNGLRQTILSRLSQLDDSTRQIMEVASVLGQRFSHQLIAQLMQMGEQFEPLMQQVWASGFIVPESQLYSQFRHHSLWEMVYNNIAPQQRQGMHANIYQQLKQATEQGLLLANPVLLAYHANCAGLEVDDLSDYEENANFSAAFNDDAFEEDESLFSIESPEEASDLYNSGLENLSKNPSLASLQLSHVLLSNLLPQPVQLTAAMALSQLAASQARPHHAHRLLSHILLNYQTELRDDERLQMGHLLAHQSFRLGHWREGLSILEQCHENEWYNGLSCLQQLPASLQVQTVRALCYQLSPLAEQWLTSLAQTVANPSNNAEGLLKTQLELLQVEMRLLSAQDPNVMQQLFSQLLVQIKQYQLPPAVMARWGILRSNWQINNGDVNTVGPILESTLIAATESNEPYLIAQAQLLNAFAAGIAIEGEKFTEAISQAYYQIDEYELSGLKPWLSYYQVSLALMHQQDASTQVDELKRLAQNPLINDLLVLHALDERIKAYTPQQ